jgi:choline transport protein
MFLNLTYIMPQALLLWRGRAVLPPRWLDLGRYGYWINLFNVVWVSFMTVIWCFPSFAAVEVSNMSIPLRYIVADLDYMSVVAVGVFVIGLIFWYTVKRKTFVGPEVSLQLLEQINARVIHQKVPESTDTGSVPST